MAATTAYPRNETARHASPRIAGSPAPYKSPTLLKESQWDSNRTPQRKRIDDIATPVTTILSSNITPRSGSRKARVESASSTPIETPSGTPVRSRPTSIVSMSNGTKCSLTSLHGPETKTLDGQITRPNASSATNGSKPLPRVPLQVNGRDTATPENEPKFFHASEAKDLCALKPLSQRLNAQQPKSPCFFYANGEVDDGIPASSSTTSPLLNEVPLSKFFHANGASEITSKSDSRTEGYLPRAKTFSQLENLQTSPKQGAFSPGPLHRPPSPLKEVSVARRNSKQSSPRSSVVSANRPLRRSSLKSLVQTPPHSRSKSVASIEHNITTVHDDNSLASGTFVEEPASFPPDLQTQSTLPIATPLSPIKTVLDSNHDVAASARRERKVLDLEISNSSLLAINRTLEREMRKQNNELRRYRRLTQAGRLSLARSNHSVSTQRLSTLASEDSELSDGEDCLDFDTFEYDGNDEDEEDEESMLSTVQEPLSPSTRQRAKDAKRLQLDLSRHHELIVDSQKLNQSIKRCLGWTDTLIEEGKKALAYHVHLSKVEATGGRVLRREETGLAEDEMGRGGALLSPGLDGVEEFIGDEDTTTLSLEDLEVHGEDRNNDSRESAFSMISSPEWKRRKQELGIYDDDASTIGTGTRI